MAELTPVEESTDADNAPTLIDTQNTQARISKEARISHPSPEVSDEYGEALDYLYHLERAGVRLGLDRMRRALELRGRPDRRVKWVHVAGTNGKGSVSAMVTSALKQEGLRVGTFTSPHLHRFVERIRINGRPVSESQITQAIQGLRRNMAEPGFPRLSFFEASFMLACEIFAQASCDVAVAEVGLGGRLDATNVIEPLVSVLTHVGFDHQHVLGDTLGEIAQEKACIAKRNVPFLCAASPPEVLAVVQQVTQAIQAPLLTWGKGMDHRPGPGGADHVSVGRETVRSVMAGLVGDHQQQNARTAAATLLALRGRGLFVSDDSIRNGIRAARWPARLETIRDVHPCPILLDVAHNPDGCHALAAHLAQESKKQPVQGPTVLVFGTMTDKHYDEMLTALDPVVDAHVFVSAGMARSTDVGALAMVRPGATAQTVEEGLDLAVEKAGSQGRVVIAGSIFVVARARAHLLGVATDPPIAM